MATAEYPWKPGTVFLRTETSEGHVAFTRHTCWNIDLFLRTQQEIAKEEGGNAISISEEEFKRNNR